MARRAALLLCVLLLTRAAAGEEPQAAVQPVVQPPAWLEAVRSALHAVGAATVVVGDARLPVDALAPDGLSRPVLLALSSVSPDRVAAGQRLDGLLLPLEGASVPVSVEVGAGEVRVVEGPPVAAWPTPPSADALRERWGITLIERGASWHEPARRALHLGLLRLSPEERALLTGVHFVRTPADPRGEGASAWYRLETEGDVREVLVFDRAFALDAVTFAGPPTAPVPASTLAILHELGHALADLAGRHAMLEVERERAEARAAARAWTRAAQDLNARADALADEAHGLHPDDVAARRTALDARTAQLLAEQRALEARMAALEPAARRAAGLREHPPAVVRHARLPGALDGPTAYGRTHPAEAFAEAFALWRTHPDAFRRLAPHGAAWFDDGGHLEGLAAP